LQQEVINEGNEEETEELEDMGSDPDAMESAAKI